jgi:hypothetical protein
MSERATLPPSSEVFDRVHQDSGREVRQPLARPRFQVTVSAFEGDHDRRTIDALAAWVERTYAADLAQRPSKHVYIRHLPAEVVARIDTLRSSEVVLAAIRRQFAASSVVTPMAHTDELYISHYNKDRGGDQGLFDRHYDGNLRFLSSSMVVRALIYLQSDASYKVVFADSRVEKAFTTYEFGLLDFHRELHWVEGSYTQGAPQRILLKCNYLVTVPGAGVRGRFALAANTAVFYVVKAAMEYSKSPRTPAQKAVGYLCNLFRRLNIVHPLVPLAAIAATAIGVAALGYFVVNL